MAQARVCPECKTIGLNSCHHKVPGYTEVCDGYARDGCQHHYCNGSKDPREAEVSPTPFEQVVGGPRGTRPLYSSDPTLTPPQVPNRPPIEIKEVEERVPYSVPYRSTARIDDDCDACSKPLLTEVHRIEAIRYVVANGEVRKGTGVRDTRQASLCGTCITQVFADMGLEGYDYMRRGR